MFHSENSFKKQPFIGTLTDSLKGKKALSCRNIQKCLQRWFSEVIVTNKKNHF